MSDNGDELADPDPAIVLIIRAGEDWIEVDSDLDAGETVVLLLRTVQVVLGPGYQIEAE